MTKYNFTHTGGLGLTQDILKDLQANSNTLLEVLGAMGNASNLPVTLSGMAVSGGGNTVASGWFTYNGELVQLAGGTVTPGGGDVALVTISTTNTTKTFKNGTTPTLITVRAAALTTGATVTDANNFPVSALVGYGAGLGKKNAVTGSLAVSTGVLLGNITGTVNWKHDKIGNTLQLRAALAVGNVTGLSDTNYAAIDLGSIGIVPAARAPFQGQVYFGSLTGGGQRTERVSGAYFDVMNLWLETDGHLWGDFIEPGAAFPSGYLTGFNAVIMLD